MLALQLVVPLVLRLARARGVGPEGVVVEERLDHAEARRHDVVGEHPGAEVAVEGNSLQPYPRVRLAHLPPSATANIHRICDGSVSRLMLGT